MGDNTLSGSINSLVKRCQQNDREAWDKLVEHLHPRVEGHALSILKRYGKEWMAGPHLQDIVNYLWKDVIENIYKFEKGDFELWFAYRRKKRVSDYLRREAKHYPPGAGAGKKREVADSDPCVDPWQQCLLHQVHAGLEKLPPKYAKMLLLYYGDGLSYKEIADHLGMGHNSIGSLHSRAKKKLKKILK